MTLTIIQNETSAEGTAEKATTNSDGTSAEYIPLTDEPSTDSTSRRKNKKQKIEKKDQTPKSGSKMNNIVNDSESSIVDLSIPKETVDKIKTTNKGTSTIITTSITEQQNGDIINSKGDNSKPFNSIGLSSTWETVGKNGRSIKNKKNKNDSQNNQGEEAHKPDSSITDDTQNGTDPESSLPNSTILDEVEKPQTNEATSANTTPSSTSATGNQNGDIVNSEDDKRISKDKHLTDGAISDIWETVGKNGKSIKNKQNSHDSQNSQDEEAHKPDSNITSNDPQNSTNSESSNINLTILIKIVEKPQTNEVTSTNTTTSTTSTTENQNGDIVNHRNDNSLATTYYGKQSTGNDWCIEDTWETVGRNGKSTKNKQNKTNNQDEVHKPEQSTCSHDTQISTDSESSLSNSTILDEIVDQPHANEITSIDTFTTDTSATSTTGSQNGDIVIFKDDKTPSKNENLANHNGNSLNNWENVVRKRKSRKNKQDEEGDRSPSSESSSSSHNTQTNYVAVASFIASSNPFSALSNSWPKNEDINSRESKIKQPLHNNSRSKATATESRGLKDTVGNDITSVEITKPDVPIINETSTSRKTNNRSKKNQNESTSESKESFNLINDNSINNNTTETNASKIVTLILIVIILLILYVQEGLRFR